jgi:hypothetical protein
VRPSADGQAAAPLAEPAEVGTGARVGLLQGVVAGLAGQRLGPGRHPQTTLTNPILSPT